jgi:heme-degrading monooxygenase HmoA
MVARQWVGETLAPDADSYGKYLEETGVEEIRATKGNQGVWLMRRLHEDRAEFVVISLWDTLESIKAFAGPEYERAVYYPEDERFLLKLDPLVRHYEVLVMPAR